jgi:DNA-binding transcriptional LysR family regulator
MDRFLCIQAFVRVAQAGSFVAAARQLRVTPSVVTSRIKHLEKLVQSPLFHRTTRAVTLSEAGTNFIGECTDMVAHMESITERMSVLRGTPAGVIRLQVLPGFAVTHLGNILKDFAAKNPKIDFDVTVSDEAVSAVGEGYDIMLQLFKRQQMTMIERPLARIQRVFCASTDYLARHGMPLSPADLPERQLGLYSAYPAGDRWTFTRAGVESLIQLPARLRTNSVHMLRDFALTGAGVVCLPTMVCSEDLLAGRLVRVLPDFECPSLELLAIYPATQRRALKVRLFVDLLSQYFATGAPWDRDLESLPGWGRR